MLTWLLDYFSPSQPSKTFEVLVPPSFVGRETDGDLYPSARDMKGFMESLKLPEGCTWFFLQPGKNQVKLQTSGKPSRILECIQEQHPDRMMALGTFPYNGGISAYHYLRFSWHPDGGVLNDWGIEISTSYRGV